MIGTGLTFAAGVGAASSVVGLIVVLLGKSSFHETFEMVGKLSVVAFLVGIGFSAILAMAARSRWLAKVSIPRFATLGAGAGLLYFLAIATNGIGRWSLADAVANLAILTVIGGASAAGTLMVARRGGRELESSEQTSRLLGER
jgi:hypothetical protein